MSQRQKFKDGQLEIKIEEVEFSMAEYNAMVASVADEVTALKAIQKTAVAEQMAKDEESLARLKVLEEENKQVGFPFLKLLLLLIILCTNTSIQSG